MLEEELAPIRRRRAYYENNLPQVMEILKTGCEKAEEKARQTLSAVRKSMKIDYFDDNSLL